MALVSRSFRSIGWLLGALWLALAPLGVFWARLCVCGEAPRVLCCAHPATTRPDPCCPSESERACCERSSSCTHDCSGCQLQQVDYEWARLNSVPSWEPLIWVVDLPSHSVEPTLTPIGAIFGLPRVRNHSPPAVPDCPRAPPLC
jgi:hypothetical protein